MSETAGSLESPSGGISGFYFSSSEDADAWLSFDADPQEREDAAYAENDRYAEWHRWQQRWVDEGY